MQILTGRKITRRIIWQRRIAVIIVVVLLIAGWFAYRPALNRYRIWKQQRALAQAREFLANKDLMGAKLALEVALAAVPGNPEALRVAADLLEQVGSPEVMKLRRRLVQLAPDSAEDRAALVMSALRFRDLNAARDALRDMPPEQANQTDALKAALAYATTTDNKPVADALFDRLQELEPDNENLKVFHALLRIKNSRPEIVSAARSELEKLSRNPRHTLFINRELMLDAMMRQDTTEAKRLAGLISADQRAIFTDHLHAANLALNVDKRPFTELFTQLSSLAGKSAADAVEFVRWLILIGHASEAKTWLASLPPVLQSAPSVTAVNAEVATALEDWDRLSMMLENGAWGAVNQDTVRLAFSSQLAAQRNNAALQRQIWDEALNAAGRSMRDLTMLYRLSSIWAWENESERTLWTIVRSFPTQAWAHQTLFNVYRARKDTDNMRALIGALREGDATTPRYKYDWALLSLLVTRTPAWTPAKQAMYELNKTDPANASYATGYAMALAQSDKGPEALTVVEKLSQEELALPARAPYLAYIYGVARRKVEMEKYAAVQSQLTQFLPEEAELIRLGREAVDRPLPKKIESAIRKTESKSDTSQVEPDEKS